MTLVLIIFLAIYIFLSQHHFPISGHRAAPTATATHQVFHPFGFWYMPTFTTPERIALFVVLGIAMAGLLYAAFLVGIIRRADHGTAKMKEVATAIRQGSVAYLRRQRRTLLPLIGIITILLVLTASKNTAAGWNLPLGRAIAFLMGAFFSMAVGTFGMLMATEGNLVVAAAAPRGFGKALQLGYRTGTVTGMLNDGLGLLGATLIFMYFGNRAPEALLGFGFGGTLLALFMRVGGGIYTKAADVGADLVGKVEKDIPEDDPRNAATIADNVGDNVGDCAGMAADIFESYEVTMVAAMILGWASFGHIGMMFPLLVRAVGVASDMIATFTVRAAGKGDSQSAMKAITRGYHLGALLSTLGLVAVGFWYLRFDASAAAQIPHLQSFLNAAPWWANFGVHGLDMRPAEATLVGITLALVLNVSTEYFTGTHEPPVESLVKSCSTGHATNIITGLSVGMESSVSAAVVLACCVSITSLIFYGANPIFVAYGIAMCGIGMLTLAGNTLSMDVFGPVADNANGIGEMGYDAAAMGEANHRAARQVLADLDATGNTTKALTKGVAIGSAVIAAVSLYAAFITLVGTGGVSDHARISEQAYRAISGMISVANPKLLVGLLLGGAVPFLFSSMTIRAVGRAAFLIVRECREQFRDERIWRGEKKPDYGRVVYICTSTAQRELIGPGFLAILSPLLVGFLLGIVALAGFLAGAILSGQLLAAFMTNAGGAWDNAKKTIEDEPRNPAANRGKGSERHKAAVTGDTVGDPLKDTAGPAINPLLKVMNMVALLAIPLMLPFDGSLWRWEQAALPAGATFSLSSHPWIAPVIGVAATLLIAWAVYRSKHQPKQLTEIERQQHED
ncbi:MAG: sodium-translocating pyrophosphatase [Phycisphaerales bacterium]|nr:sodium-translocating pyrophosphatase [Phycisphaerales bacterium]